MLCPPPPSGCFIWQRGRCDQSLPSSLNPQWASTLLLLTVFNSCLTYPFPDLLIVYPALSATVRIQTAVSGNDCDGLATETLYEARVQRWSSSSSLACRPSPNDALSAGEMVDMLAILYTQADVNQYAREDFKATADRMGKGLLAAHDASGPPREPAVYCARSGKLLDFSLNRERSAAASAWTRLHAGCPCILSWLGLLLSDVEPGLCD